MVSRPALAQRSEVDPVLAALEGAPLVPLSAEEKQLLAECEAEPERRIPHAEVAAKILARSDAA